MYDLQLESGDILDIKSFVINVLSHSSLKTFEKYLISHAVETLSKSHIMYILCPFASIVYFNSD